MNTAFLLFAVAVLGNIQLTAHARFCPEELQIRLGREKPVYDV